MAKFKLQLALVNMHDKIKFMKNNVKPKIALNEVILQWSTELSKYRTYRTESVR